MNFVFFFAVKFFKMDEFEDFENCILAFFLFKTISLQKYAINVTIELTFAGINMFWPNSESF